MGNQILVSPCSKKNAWNFSLPKMFSIYKFFAGCLNKAFVLLLCPGRISIRAHPENGVVHTQYAISLGSAFPVLRSVFHSCQDISQGLPVSSPRREPSVVEDCFQPEVVHRSSSQGVLLLTGIFIGGGTAYTLH